MSYISKRNFGRDDGLGAGYIGGRTLFFAYNPQSLR